MAEMTLQQAAERIKGRLLQGSPSLKIEGFTTDTRQAREGDLFFALTAERDGHDFIHHAVQKKTAGAVISREIELPSPEFGLIMVKDTLKALQTLAASVLREHPVKVVGITGSCGKTSAKEYTASLLARKHMVLKSEKSFNNHIGLPLSLLKLNKFHEVAVLEMGMNHPGEIKDLTQIAPPDLAVITNIMPVHLQFFKNLREIARAKTEILRGAKKGAVAVLNGDDSLLMNTTKDWEGKKITFGLSLSCTIRAENIRTKGYEGYTLGLVYGHIRTELTLPVFYKSYLFNFLAAVAVAYSFSLPLEDILKTIPELKPLPMRGELLSLDSRIKVINDSYNSSPVALEMALNSIRQLPGKRKIAVLGDMLELGKNEVQFHRQAGKKVAESGFDILVTVGPLSRHMAKEASLSGMPNIFTCQDSLEAVSRITSLLQDGDLILIKGSRKIGLEKIIQNLQGREA